jgi:hypothetical protein
MKRIIIIGAASLVVISGIIFAKFKLGQKNDINEPKKMTEKDIRQPAAAGTFYPDDPTELKNKISNLLSNSELRIDNSKIINLLIVPHAGYEYSGSVAAAGFKQIQTSNYDKVILLGASHQSYFEGIAVDENTAWQTPLGQVNIDLVTAQKIVDADESFNFNSSAHSQDHSLEVQLPFLQTVLDNFKIVPILLGQATEKDVNNLANTIHQNLTANTLLVISTDLSHYPSYDLANSIDERTINSILTGDPEKFEKKANEQMSQGYPNLDTVACAEKAVKTGMIIAQNFDGNWQLIKYANSGDAVGEKSRVVGYAAIVHLGGGSLPVSSEVDKLNQNQKESLLGLARETLEGYIKEAKKPKASITDPALQEQLGCFVTLRKNGQLRGCMGEFSPTTPLWQTVIDRTVVAATQDPRFSPVEPDELKDISLEISVLSKPEPIDDWQKIELGIHGVIVQKGNRSGTYLPQVGTEHNWNNIEDFLSNLCQSKAGLPADCYKDKNVDLLTYTADVFSE